ncbi:hypothetical protein DAPPUDRAFT_254757 [Daphnia pulex]|uniref:Uncharacterized protein n=1 Tax=Daphnia pulex TaxID=6669 RepID=E9H7U4_DAPPU|nr:hypothetical protein DAPPUDRAFT_254757 [Daphnia pulex]|eukprot:EFX72243.1 hypothetical protein DAPPUDRAFT_254757 [Daphnia pulex]
MFLVFLFWFHLITRKRILRLKYLETMLSTTSRFQKLNLSIPTRFQQIGQTKPEAERFGNHAVHRVQIPEAE